MMLQFTIDQPHYINCSPYRACQYVTILSIYNLSRILNCLMKPPKYYLENQQYLGGFLLLVIFYESCLIFNQFINPSIKGTSKTSNVMFEPSVLQSLLEIFQYCLLVALLFISSIRGKNLLIFIRTQETLNIRDIKIKNHTKY